METPSYKEKFVSQIPALTLLHNLGYTYIKRKTINTKRGGRLSNVLLEDILLEQLNRLNQIHYRGKQYPFSEANIHSAVQTLKTVTSDGLLPNNAKIYDLLCLGRSLQQTIEGSTKSFPFHYIDWNPETWLTNNVFHVTDEFDVECTGSHKTLRPDIVLFVNGIPLVVIECKSPAIKDPMGEAIRQQRRNQQADAIPKLFLYAQLLMAVSKNEALYGTVGTEAKFWTTWEEKPNDDNLVKQAIRFTLSEDQSNQIYADYLESLGDQAGGYAAMERQVTPQDRALYALCRPERLLEVMYRYTLFDAGEKKLCRYQQYFCVKKILKRIPQRLETGARQGGVVWHTQGSGKSLTMVFLALGLALAPEVGNYKIILVTDRVDLDEQIYNTFTHCGAEPAQAKTGKDLAQLITDPKQHIITTVIDKFETVVSQRTVKSENPNIFVLVDESHRGQFGILHGKMRKVLPQACFIGFTGTPILKTEKNQNTLARFGGLIDSYPLQQAVKDKMVLPLLYEGRHVNQKVDSESIDEWFERITQNLTKEQQIDLKRKFSGSDQLNKAEQKAMRIAWDISEHFSQSWQGTGFKAQLAAPDQSTALLYQRFFEQFGKVSSAVLMSYTDASKKEAEDVGNNPESIQAFWKKVTARYGSVKEYKKQTINAFKSGNDPEIIIVVNMLLTGFDAPRNTVLYLAKMLKEHTLLQAIARVNRIYEGKDFGYILDYRGVLANLDHALDIYNKLSEFDEDGLNDLSATLTDIHKEVDKLPQRHSDLWGLFKAVKRSSDTSEFEAILRDEAIRAKFKERLSAYARTFSIALSSLRFVEETPLDKLERYRSDLRFFMDLRASVRSRYSESVDFKEYEGQIQKLINTHVGTGKVEIITPLVSIFDTEAFEEEVEKLQNNASKADTIAYRTKKTIHERMDEDPIFYKKFSELLEKAIEDYRQKRISDNDYLNRAKEVQEKVKNRTDDEIPERLKSHEVARAFYGEIIRHFTPLHTPSFEPKSVSVEVSLAIDSIILQHRIVNWTNNPDVQKQMDIAIADYLYDLKDQQGIDLDFDAIDQITEHCLSVARVRYPL